MIQLFTHTDLDGVGSSILSGLMHEDFSVQYCDNSDIDTDILNFIHSGKYRDFDKVIISDLSVKLEAANLIDSLEKSNPGLFELYDHHKTAEWLNKYSWANVVIEIDGELQCGTSLFYRNVYKHGEDAADCSESYKNLVKTFVESVRSWDTWSWTTNGNLYSEDLSTLLKERGISEFVTSMQSNLMRCRMFSSADQTVIAAARLKERKYLDSMKNNWFELEYKGKKFAAIFASQYVSKLGNLISTENPDLAGTIMLTEYGLSLRTDRDDIDVGEIAHELGGGGHAKSSGVTFDENVKRKVISYALNILSNKNFRIDD